jgi:hypothetical protein
LVLRAARVDRLDDAVEGARERGRAEARPDLGQDDRVVAERAAAPRAEDEAAVPAVGGES